MGEGHKQGLNLEKSEIAFLRLNHDERAIVGGNA